MSESAPDTARRQLAATIDTIERAYEYMLAYAAQGRTDDAGTDARATIETLYAALATIGPQARAAFPGRPEAPAAGAALDPDAVASVAHYLDAVERDALIARGAVGLVLTRPHMGSLLVDNLNASVHLRALLTDAFLLDQALQSA